MVFGGSTNVSGILNDTTGNRRFWCVEVANTMDIDLLVSIKKELWSEAYQAFLANEQWVLTESERAQLEETNSAFEADDPLKDFLAQELELINSGFDSDNKIGSARINQIAKKYDTRAHPQTISKIMIKLGWIRTKFTSGPNKDCACYERPKKD